MWGHTCVPRVTSPFTEHGILNPWYWYFVPFLSEYYSIVWWTHGPSSVRPLPWSPGQYACCCDSVCVYLQFSQECQKWALPVLWGDWILPFEEPADQPHSRCSLSHSCPQGVRASVLGILTPGSSTPVIPAPLFAAVQAHPRSLAVVLFMLPAVLGVGDSSHAVHAPAWVSARPFSSGLYRLFYHCLLGFSVDCLCEC